MDFLPHLYAFFLTLPGGELLWSVMMFIVVLGILVFVHEWGHYSAARSVGVHAEAFSIGFGPELFGWTDKYNTRWKLCAFPLGGYVAMYGFDPTQDIPVNRQHEAFGHKNVWQRMWVIFAGPGINFVFPIVALALVFSLSGEQRPVEFAEQPAILGTVQPGTPAHAAGLQRDDVVQSIAGQAISTWPELVAAVQARPEQATTLSIIRDDSVIEVNLTPAAIQANINGEQQTIGRMGVNFQPQTELIAHNPLSAVATAVRQTWEYTAMIGITLKRLFIGQEDFQNLGGPIAIGDLAGQSGSYGFYALITFMALISVNLGVLNLLPIPVLDGGHLLFQLIEAIKGSPVSMKVQEYAYRGGLGILALLMVGVFYNDLARIFS